MNKWQTIQNFFTVGMIKIPLADFLVNLALAALLANLLARFYIKYGTSLSNRRTLACNFLLVTMTTTFIITVVKSSLALSLGLVGALSIVRFRTPIKEPEELAYLFLCIGIGLGFGADQRWLTLAAFTLICLLLALSLRTPRALAHQNLFLTVASRAPGEVTLEKILATVRNHCRSADLRRFDEKESCLEATFQVEFDGYTQLTSLRTELQSLGKSVEISFLDSKV